MAELKDILATAGEIPSAKLGSATGYFEVESDGTVIYRGTATVWDDLVGSLVASRLESIAGKLNYNYAENSITMQSAGSIANINDRLIFNYQYPHGAVDLSKLHVHIHWEQPDATAREFTLEYRIQNNGSAKTTAWTQVIIDTSVNNKFSYTSGTLNQITELFEIDMTGASISATVQCRLARTDAVAGDIEATFIDAHVERDMNGSRSEYVK